MSTAALNIETQIEVWPIDSVIPYDRNPRKITPAAVSKVARSIERFGFNVPCVVDEQGVILTGHTRRQALLALGANEVAVIVKTGLSEEEKRAYRIADNRVAEETAWDEDLLKIEMLELTEANLNLDVLGFDAEELNRLMSDVLDGDGQSAPDGQPAADVPGKGSLAARFGIPPFTVLNAREGWWQDRKRAWLALGIRSEVGRGAAPGGGGGAYFGQTADGERAAAVNYGAQAERTSMAKGLAFGEIANYDGAERTINGTSIFDPVLCELAYRWFCPPGGVVLDPFAGGSVRGVVASRLGREYHGVDLRPEQVEANVEQLPLCTGPAPTWYRGDSRDLDTIVPRAIKADFIFTCPPYADLEVYSDDPADLSAMSYPEFLKAYERIIRLAADRLKPCRFAVVVIGDARGPDGNYYGLPWKTVEFAEAAGMRLYNEAVLVTAVGSLPVRAGIPFETTRKMGKSHQNVLVFVKGDARAAARDIGPCEFGEDVDLEAAAAAAGSTGGSAGFEVVNG